MHIAVASPHNRGRCNANVAAHANCRCKPTQHRKMQHKGSSSCELSLQAHTTQENATRMWQLMRIVIASPHNTGKCNANVAAHANCRCKPTQHRKVQRKCGSSCTLLSQAHTTEEGATKRWQLMRIAVASPHNTGWCNANVAIHALCCRKPIRQRRVQQKGGSSCAKALNPPPTCFHCLRTSSAKSM